MATYVILRAEPESTTASNATYQRWAQVSEVLARSSSAAIREFVDDDDDGTYVAVPARSFRPAKVTSVKTLRMKIEQLPPKAEPLTPQAD